MLFCWMMILVADVTGTNLYERAMAAYDQGLGQAAATTAAGYARASQVVGPRIDSATFSFIDEGRIQGHEATEREIALTFEMSLARLPKAQRTSLAALGASVVEQGRQQRGEFLAQVISAYAAVALARAQFEHADAWHGEAAARDAEMARPEVQALVSRLERLEQVSFTSMLADERRAASVAEREARAQLAALIGPDFTLAQPQVETVLRADNPYPRLLAQVARLPELRLLARDAERQDAAAELAYAATAPRLGFNLQHRGAGENAWLGAGLQLSWSLGRRRGPEWQQQRAEAEAARLHGQMRSQALSAELNQRAEAFSARQARNLGLRDERIASLRQRAEQWQQAVERGFAERRIWLNALAEQHEAEHELLALSFDLWEEHTRILLLARFCEETP